jgi:hypothetical protein
MINNFTSYIFHPILILCRLWRIIYFPLIYLFNLPLVNHDNMKNAHVLSLVYSVITSLISPYTFYLVYNNYLLANQINITISKFVYNLSISYFISDLSIGIQYYPNILNNNILTSYIHHSAYISLLLYGNYYNKIHLFILGMPYEIPTLLLNLRYIKIYKNHILFGLLFFIFRILYNIFILYITYNFHNDIFIFSICTMIVHSYWFINYVKKYLL